jgi:hypothetical protein
VRRGARWGLEPGKVPCRCGTETGVLVNLRSREQRLLSHVTPAGALCPEVEWQEAVERTRAIVSKALGEEYA